MDLYTVVPFQLLYTGAANHGASQMRENNTFKRNENSES